MASHSGEQMATKQNAKQANKEHKVGQPGAEARFHAVARQWFRGRRNEPPGQAKDHGSKYQNANAFMYFWRTVIPGVVIAQSNHP